jgi:hypothetical protein
MTSQGGPLPSYQRWTFRGTRYEMEGYPSIARQGTFSVTSDEAAPGGGRTLTVRFTRTRACGPCEGNPRRLEPRPPHDAEATLSADGSTLRLAGLELRRER